MDTRTRTHYLTRARIVKAMAHPTRLFIVEELSRSGEQCVQTLTAMIGADISTVSKHLSVLKRAGLVQDEKRGVQVFYCLGVKCLRPFLKFIGDVLRHNVEDQLQKWKDFGVDLST
jgi:DNA-binding transcriptional ArsR family regulator